MRWHWTRHLPLLAILAVALILRIVFFSRMDGERRHSVC